MKNIIIFSSICSCFAAMGIDFQSRYDSADIRVQVAKNTIQVFDRNGSIVGQFGFGKQDNGSNTSDEVMRLLNGRGTVENNSGVPSIWAITIDNYVKLHFDTNGDLFIDQCVDSADKSIAVDADCRIHAVGKQHYNGFALRSSVGICNWGNIDSKSWALNSKKVFNFGNIGYGRDNAIDKYCDSYRQWMAFKDTFNRRQDGSYNFGRIYAKTCTAQNTDFYQQGALNVNTFYHLGNAQTFTVNRSTDEGVNELDDANTYIEEMHSVGLLLLERATYSTNVTIGSFQTDVPVSRDRMDETLYEPGSSLILELPAMQSLERSHTFCGMTNLGYTCFGNAAIQGLYSMDSVRNGVLNYYGTHKAVRLLRELFEKLNANRGAISDSYMRMFWNNFALESKLNTLKNAVYSNKQEDSGTCFWDILDMLEGAGVGTKRAYSTYDDGVQCYSFENIYGNNAACEPCVGTYGGQNLLPEEVAYVDAYKKRLGEIRATLSISGCRPLSTIEYAGDIKYGTEGHYWCNVGAKSLDDSRVYDRRSGMMTVMHIYQKPSK